MIRESCDSSTSSPTSSSTWLWPPPRFTLFPYTTLFRSGPEADRALEHYLSAIANAVRAFRQQQHVFVILLPERSEEHTSELQSRGHLVCRLLLEKKKCQSRGNKTGRSRRSKSAIVRFTR